MPPNLTILRMEVVMSRGMVGGNGPLQLRIFQAGLEAAMRFPNRDTVL